MKRHELVKEHIKRAKERYRNSSKWEKGIILSEICRTWNLDRKHVIKLLTGIELSQEVKPRAGRKPSYDSRLMGHILYLWEQMERISAKRMKVALHLWLPYYRAQEFDSQLRAQLLKMSASTLERWIKVGLRRQGKGLSTTRKPKFFRYKIPIFDGVTRDITYPGHVHADTVAHCGESIIGQFASTLTVTDRMSQWTENRAMINKETQHMKLALTSIEEALPFRLRSFQNDCGSEFLNYSMMRYLESRGNPVTMVRSRPYHKNDNAHVEQKNFTHVREIFGYERLTGEELVARMNEIYSQYWNPLNNFFLPSMKLSQKQRYGGKIKKRYGPAKTPYQRLMECENLDDIAKARLRNRFSDLNPFVIKKELERKLDLFFRLARTYKNQSSAA